MKIGVDISGGDFAPSECIQGVQDCIASGILTPDQITLFAYQEEITSTSTGCELVLGASKIGMSEHPAKALKEKADSSIALGFAYLQKEKIDAFISAGNTGAMLVGAHYTLKPITGLQRPSIASIIPRLSNTPGLLLDVGLNADCKPEVLNQIALLGSIYASNMYQIANPRVALLNIGEEEGKGNMLMQACYPLLKANTKINFIGNVEGRDILQDKADVIVCDGFTGNVILKMIESLYNITQEHQIRHPYFEKFNHEIYGGTPILGLSKPVIIGHGIAKARAFSEMLKLAKQLIDNKVCDMFSGAFN